jgi:hypothetical protein
MLSVPPQAPRSWWRRFWRAICDLHFITAFFTWLFLLLSRLAEPLMTLSAIYIILCAGIPQWKLDGLYNTGVAVMIGAPEVILPGSFVLAGQYSARGDVRAKLLYWVSWFFVLLTFLTLGDLFLFHWPQDAVSILMWGRCAVSISYSILLRVLTHDQGDQSQRFFPQPSPAPEIDYQELARHLIPLMPAPHVDYQEIAQQLEATFKAMVVREIREIQGRLAPAPIPQRGSEANLGSQTRVPFSGSHPSLGNRSQEPRSLLGATYGSQAREPAYGSGPTGGSHTLEPLPGSGATSWRQIAALTSARDPRQGQPESEENPAGREARAARLEVAYQELVAAGIRVSGRALADRARCKRAAATEWLRAKTGAIEGNQQEDVEPEQEVV